MPRRPLPPALLAPAGAVLLLLGGCGQATGGNSEAGAKPFDGIAAGETIRLTGTEPFWGGEVAGGTLLYSTPEAPAGVPVAVRRFAGLNGLAFSGALEGQNMDLLVTPGACSDGMSDREYPYVATLQIGDEQRTGCAWTARKPFREGTAGR